MHFKLRATVLLIVLVCAIVGLFSVLRNRKREHDLPQLARRIERLTAELKPVETHAERIDSERLREVTLYDAPELKYSRIRVEREYERTKNGGMRRLRTRAMVADHFIVRLRKDRTKDDLQKLLDRFDASIRRELRLPGAYVVALSERKRSDLRRTMTAFRKEASTVAYAATDNLVFVLDAPDDPKFVEQWGLHNTGQSGGVPDADIDAVEAWNAGTGSRDVVVAVIDTGVQYLHDDLAANIWTNPGEVVNNGIDDDGNGYIDDVHGYDFYNDDADPMDDQSHGTHCAGILGAVGNNGIGGSGVCWNVSIMPLKFIDNTGSGFDSDAIDAIMYTANHGATITSNSWGGSDSNPAAEDAIAYAADRGGIFVAAAGNDSEDAELSPIYPAAYTDPSIISVAATDHNDTLASFSNYGSTSVDLAAPGQDILSTVPLNDYRNKKGTSMACPFVAGAVALQKSIFPNRTATELKQAILDRVDTRPGLAGKCVSGGRLNVMSMLLVLQSAELMYTGQTIDDTAGNGDGYANPGEQIDLTVLCRNLGVEDAGSVSATLSSSDDNVTVVEAAISFGDAPGMAIETTADEAFVIAIDSDCPTPHVVQFELSLTDGTATWDESFPVTVYTSSTVQGTVRLDGNPLESATVAYSGVVSGQVDTEADGTYSFVAVDGDYNVVVSHADYLPATDSFTAAPGLTLDFDFETVTVGGTVTDELSGDPVNEVTISYAGDLVGTTETALDGTYSFTRVLGRTETLLVTASKKGVYHDSPVEIDVPPSIPDLDFSMVASDISLSPSPITATCVVNESTDEVVTVDNAGAGFLSWKIPQTTYIASDSDQPDGPVYDWIDISATGNQILGIGDDDNLGPFDLGFSFPFFGQSYDQFYLCTNGWISFTSQSTRFLNAPLPSEFAPENIVALYWDDLTPLATGKAYYQQLDAETLVVSYENFAFYKDDTRSVSVQALLKSDGRIKIQIKKAGIRDSCTIGIQNILQDQGVEVCYNQEYVHDHMAIRIDPFPSWLTVSPSSSGVAPLGQGTTTFTFDGAAADIGTHFAHVLVESNDPDEARLTLPLTFTVNADAANNSPIAENLTVSTDENTAVVCAVTAIDADGDPLTYNETTVPAHGELSGIGPDWTYTPDTGWSGTDSFSFIANDGTADSNVAMVTITVNDVNDPPVAVATTADSPTVIGATVTLSGSDSYDPDSGPDPLKHTWTYLSGPEPDPGPELTTTDGAITTSFSPAENGVYTFELTVDDGEDTDRDEIVVLVGDSLILTIPATVKEGDGDLAGTVKTTRVPGTGETVSITLVSDDESELIVIPETVSIGPGADSAAFTVQIQDDSELDGAQTVLLRASAAAWNNAQAEILVADNDAPSITVLGNDIVIPDGDVTPASADGTDFGTLVFGDDSQTRTFTIRNDGSAPLQLTGSPAVQLDGSNAFTIESQPAPSIAPGETSSLTVLFAPVLTGARSATVRIATNDPDRADYDFALQAEVLESPPPLGFGGSNEDDDGCQLTVGGSIWTLLPLVLTLLLLGRRRLRTESA